jgi:hypothetical protein
MSPIYGRSHHRTVSASFTTTAIEETNPLGETTHVVGVKASCSECGHETQSFGTTRDSRTRCLALLRDECPMGESNWYVDEDED